MSRALAVARAIVGRLKPPPPPRVGPSQSNEADILDRLLAVVDTPATFCEFGFHLAEFNAGRLLLRGWRGLLIDSDVCAMATAHEFLVRHPQLPTTALCAFLDRDNARPLIEKHFSGAPLGVLSVDVDGNDYWLFAELLPLRPAIVVMEYNATFGLRPVTVPYDPAFERHQKHPSGWYHGASITALHALGARQGYSLVAVSDSGINLFFVKDALVPATMPRLEPAAAYRENQLRNLWSKKTAAEQWAAVRHLPLVEV